MSVAPLALPFLGEEAVRSISAAADEPDWLLADRLAGLTLASTLPAEANQLFTPYLDLRAARWASIAPYTAPVVAADAGTAPLPEGAAVFVHVREDRLVARALSPAARDAGVIVATFAEAARAYPELLRPVAAEGASLPDSDAFAQVARAAYALGLLVHVPAGVVLDAPIVLRWSVGEPGRGLLSRSVISLGEGARARLLEEQVDSTARTPALGAGDRPHTGAGAAGADDGQALWWGTSEVVLADGASLEVAALQDFGPSTLAIVGRQATLGRAAHLQWALASVGALLHRSRIDNLLVGRGSSVRQVEIGFGSGAQLFDLTSYTRHIGEDTTGDLLSKGVFTDRSRGYIKGLIEIRRSAKGTDSFLGEFGMLLTKHSRSVTIPSLEIDQPNVRRAAHSSSVGPIDEGQIFYLMSRGLDRETARRAIVLGFLEPVVARIPLPDAQERLRALLDHKWPRAAGAHVGAAA